MQLPYDCITDRPGLLQRLQKKHAMLRSAIKRTINRIKTLLNSSVTDPGELEERFSILQNKEVSLDEVDKEIETEVEDEALNAELEVAEYYCRQNESHSEVRSAANERH